MIRMDEPGSGRRVEQRFSDITASMAVCLRLVARGMSSKEIAQETGLSWQTVDTYLKQAMARLGVSNRREAARLFVAWENGGNPPSQKSEPPLPALGSPPDAPAQTGSTDGGSAASPRFLPPVGGSLNDLSWDQKTIKALQVAGLGVAVVIALALAMAGLLQTFR